MIEKKINNIIFWGISWILSITISVAVAYGTNLRAKLAEDLGYRLSESAIEISDSRNAMDW